jgi:hypothetical protein
MFECIHCGFKDYYLGMNHHFRKLRCQKLPKGFDVKAPWDEHARTVSDDKKNGYIEIGAIKQRKDE